MSRLTKSVVVAETILSSTKRARSGTRLLYGIASSMNLTKLESFRSNRTFQTRAKTRIWQYYHNSNRNDRRFRNWEWKCRKEAYSAHKAEETMYSILQIVWRAWTSNRRRRSLQRGEPMPMHRYNKAYECGKLWKSRCAWVGQVLQLQRRDT